MLEHLDFGDLNWNRILELCPGWFLFGAITFLGAFTTYKIVTSKIVQTIVVLVMAMLLGVAIYLGLGSAFGWLLSK
jgi:hypothetical protein